MAEPDAQPVAAAARPPKGKGKKIAGLPLPVALGAAAALVTLAYLWWRSRSSSSAGSSAAADTGQPADAATSDDIATLQAEVEQLLAEAAGQGGTGGGPGGGGTGTGSGDGSGTGSGDGSGTGSGDGGTGGGPASGAKSAKPIRAPSGTRTADVTESEFVATWQSTPAATSYRLQVTQAGRVIHEASTSSTAQKVTGLRPGSSYGWHVAAVNSHGQGPWSGTTGVHTSAAHKVGKVAGNK